MGDHAPYCNALQTSKIALSRRRVRVRAPVTLPNLFINDGIGVWCFTPAFWRLVCQFRSIHCGEFSFQLSSGQDREDDRPLRPHARLVPGGEEEAEEHGGGGGVEDDLEFWRKIPYTEPHRNPEEANDA